LTIDKAERLPRNLAVDELERIKVSLGTCKSDVEARKRDMAEAFKRLKETIDEGDISKVREEFEGDFSSDIGKLMNSFDECMECFDISLQASDVLIRILQSELAKR
jgi:hypothetical protein